MGYNSCFTLARLFIDILMDEASEECITFAIGNVKGVRLHIIYGSSLNVPHGFVLVNAANENLTLGGGVAGVIRDRGGHIIQEECNKWLRSYRITSITSGMVAVTSAGNFRNFQYIFHTVGPTIRGNVTEKNKQDLVSAVIGCFCQADEIKAPKIVIPAISVGIFSYPLDLAAKQHIDAFLIYSRNNKKYGSSLQDIYLCMYKRKEFDAFQAEFISRMNHFDFVEVFG